MPDRIFLGGNPLNSEQKSGIERAFGSNATFVWGPPGTGKTTMLARIVEAFYHAGKSVLLVSNTNIAVDTALEKVAERLETDSGFQAGAVIRFGPVVKPELEVKYGDRIVLDSIVSRLSQDLNREREHLSAEQVRLQTAAQPIQTALEEREKVEALRAQADHARASLAAAYQEHNAIGRQIETTTTRIKQLQSDLDRAATMGSLRRFFARLDVNRLQGELRTSQIEQQAQTAALKASVDRTETHERSVKLLLQQCQDQDDRLRHYPSLLECRAKLKEFTTQIASVGARLDAIQKELEVLREDVTKRCRVMATTIYRTYLKGQVAREFDVVLIDEASMLMLPMTYYAAGLAKEAVVVAGDFRQLPPIVASGDALAQEWLARDAFEQSGISLAVKRGQKPPHLVALRTQYRMHPAICTVVNSLS